MSLVELNHANRTIYYRKSISDPKFTTTSILTRDAWSYVELWLKRQRKQEALVYWYQARDFHAASKRLPPVSAPLTLYYCFMNAAKALLLAKNVNFSDRHGVSGQVAGSKRSLEAEVTELKSKGIVSDLAKYLKEPETTTKHSLKEIFGNLAFIHRAYCLTYNTSSEMLMPLRNPIYMKDNITNEVVFQADVTGRNADLRRLQNLLPGYHIVDGAHHKKYIIQRKDRIGWYRRGNTKSEREAILSGLADYHAKIRCDICCISAPTDLWYLKRAVSGTKIVNRYGLTLMLAAMHRLSELARYDPQGLATHLSGKENWLLTEFIELAPSQFIDELACEMTGLEFRLPGVRS